MSAQTGEVQMNTPGSEGVSSPAPLVVVTSFTAEVAPEALEQLRRRGFRITTNTTLSRLSRVEEVAAASAGASAIVAGSEPYTDETFQRLPDLRILVRAGAGTDGIDLESAERHGITVSSTPGVNAQTVADFTVALILSSARHIKLNDRSVRSGVWRQPIQGIDLYRQKVGIIGFGAIGRAVAQRLAGFECEIFVYDPVLKDLPWPGATLVSLDKLLTESRILTVHVPLTPQTRDLVSDRELKLMPHGSVVVNASRGGVVNEEAVLTALESGQLQAAAFDVFTDEPPAGNNPFLQDDRITLTPHVAAFSAEGSQAVLDTAIENIVQYIHLT
jgi:phosphoglycerate dehydrogenase-like enzyme